MKRLGVFLLPLDGMLVHRRVIPSIKFAGTHLYTWVERGTVRVKCLAQEHNGMTPARARTRTPRSGDERTNHEATAPPKHRKGRWKNSHVEVVFLLKTKSLGTLHHFIIGLWEIVLCKPAHRVRR